MLAYAAVRRSVQLVVLVVLVASGCDGEDPCVAGPGENGPFPLALDGRCLRDATLRQRTDGAWRGGADAPSLSYESASGGGVRVWLRGRAGAEGLELALDDLDQDAMFQQGYQSWSFSGTAWIPGSVPGDGDGVAAMTAARTGDPLDEVAGVSYHSVILRKGDTGPVLLAAALSAAHAVTGFAATRIDGHTRLSIVHGPTREALPADGGESISEALYLVAAPTPEEALAHLTTELQAAHAGNGFVPRRPPGGWFSWNAFFDDVSEADVRAQLPIIEQQLKPAGLTLVEIDDGWELAWGDWQENPRFSGGMAALAADITGRGLVAGVWLAPFLVDITSSAAASADPSLFVRGPDGTRLVHRPFGNPRDYHILDGTNPAAMRIVTDEVRRLAAAGFTFFKFDFLYAGAFVGTRSQPATGIEAMRRGLVLLREAAGTNAIINACGAPILPSLGLADSLRVGADTAFDNYDITFTFVGGAARSLAARTHLFPLVWPDADQTQVRTPLTIDEARVSAVTAALAGAPYALGDDLATSDPQRLALALDPMVLDLATMAAPATPSGLMVSPAEEVGRSPLLEGLITVSGFSTPPPTRFAATGASGTRYQIDFDWLGAHTVVITEQP